MDFSESKPLRCVQYPGRVVNPDKALETLGGITDLSNTFNSEKQRLHLTFRPNNLYSKGMYAERTKNTGILLKVKIKRRQNEVITEEVQVLGHSEAVYQFDKLCDYEMSPIMKKTPEATKAELIYDDIVPNLDHTFSSFMENPEQIPFFFPPQTFSRVDTVNTSLFKKDELNPRMKRINMSIRLLFNLTDPIPMEIHKSVHPKQVALADVEILRKKFEERPCWTMVGLRYFTKWPIQKMKVTLPLVAYYYISGPWRSLWCVYGYDPRKDFKSHIYQTQEVRLNHRTVNNIQTKLERKRTLNVTPQTKSNVFSQLVFDANATEAEKELPSNIFEPAQFRHLNMVNYYQYCDIHVPGIKELLEKIPTPIHGVKCTEKSGWLPAGFDEQCRDILMDILKDHFQMEIQMKNEGGEEGDDSGQEEEGRTGMEFDGEEYSDEEEQ